MAYDTRLVVREETSLAETFAEERRLLDEGEPAVRVGRVRDRTLSVGVAQREDAECAQAARREGIEVLRRSTGGTGVLHEAGDLVFSLILPRTHPVVGRDFHRAYGRLGAGLVTFLHRHRLEGRWTPSPGLSPDLCLLGTRGEVLSIGDRVLGGAAQHLTGRTLLHDGVLPWRLDRPRLSRIFRAGQTDLALRLTSLEEVGVPSPDRRTLETLARELAEGVDRRPESHRTNGTD